VKTGYRGPFRKPVGLASSVPPNPIPAVGISAVIRALNVLFPSHPLKWSSALVARIALDFSALSASARISVCANGFQVAANVAPFRFSKSLSRQPFRSM